MKVCVCVKNSSKKKKRLQAESSRRRPFPPQVDHADDMNASLQDDPASIEDVGFEVIMSGIRMIALFVLVCVVFV
jgi:hypothetical protein